MKEDLIAMLTGVLAIALSALAWAAGCVVLGLAARLMWIPLTFGWNLI